jgi:hypothetical protein
MSKQDLLRPARVTVLARRVSSAGVVVITVLALAVGVIIERSFFPAVVASHPTVRPTPAVRTTAATARRSRRRRGVATVALTVLDRTVRTVTMSKLGTAAQREYGKAPAGPPSVSLSGTNPARTWALGTTAIPVPGGVQAMPEVSLFLAHVVNRTWQVDLVGQPGFDGMLTQAPKSIVSAAEKDVLLTVETPSATTDTDLMLPWRVGQSWTMRSAPGGLAFSGGSGRVLAAGPGWLFRACEQQGQGLVVLVHPNGLVTVYDQMADVTTAPDGSFVPAGTLLGRTGNRLSCGGGTVAGPAAVRFAEQFGLSGVNGMLDGTVIGGWTFHVALMSGFAQHGATVVQPGGKLENFGAPVMPTEPPSPSPTPSGLLPTVLPSVTVSVG